MRLHKVTRSCFVLYMGPGVIVIKEIGFGVGM